MIGRFGVGMKAALLRMPTGAGKTFAVTAALDVLRRQRDLVVIPTTGAGKTTTFVHMARDMLGKRGDLVVPDEAHRGSMATHQGLTSQLERAWTSGDEEEPVSGVPALRLKPYEPRRLRIVPPKERYRLLRRRATEWEQTGMDQRRRLTLRQVRIRSGAASEAVITRSGGRCENPECLLPDLPYRTKRGKTLLEADHVDDHASGGRDHPAAMVALCPNCHRNKTHGVDGPELTERLRDVALKLDAEWEG
ncbi:HNH endonuclease [Streptomyces prunicolor]|uniref:HNH endonuclease n=1 Tax=Streptomyces prunicolor TaxID=67348 RepID=UPI0033DAE83A